MKAHKLITPLRVWLMAGFCCLSALAQPHPVQSVTKQFTATTLQTPSAPRPPDKLKQALVAGSSAYLLSSKAGSVVRNNDEVALSPATLVVSCERIKKLVLNRLGMNEAWRGRIDLTINPAMAEDVGPQLRAVHDAFGWTYRMELPSQVKEQVLMRSVIQTILLEIANRQAGVQSADVPFWLVEGLSADLQSTSLPTFIVQPEQNWTGDVRWNRTADTIPPELRQRAPLSFQQLSFPGPADFSGASIFYGSCARLFVEQLLRFNDGRACLASMLDQLPQRWNWQTAFLQAFHTHFTQLLDVEKWWSVSWIDYISGTRSQLWSATDCQRTLQNSLDVPVDVHFGPDQMPVEAKVTLQEVIQQWAPFEAYEAIQRSISQLRFLLPRATPDVKPFAQLYLTTLSDYLNATASASRNHELGRNPPNLLQFAKTGAVRQLDALDRQRQAARPAKVSTTSQLSALEQAAPKAPAVP